MDRLRARVHGQSSLQERGVTWATEPGGAVVLKQVTVLLEAALPIAEADENIAVLGGDFNEDLPARDPTLVWSVGTSGSCGCKPWNGL